MPWAWDASASTDVAYYVMAIALLHPVGIITTDLGPFPVYQLDPFTDWTQTTDTSVPDTVPNPPTGACWWIDIDAVDAAGNRSPP